MIPVITGCICWNSMPEGNKCAWQEQGQRSFLVHKFTFMWSCRANAVDGRAQDNSNDADVSH